MSASYCSRASRAASATSAACTVTVMIGGPDSRPSIWTVAPGGGDSLSVRGSWPMLALVVERPGAGPPPSGTSTSSRSEFIAERSALRRAHCSKKGERQYVPCHPKRREPAITPCHPERSELASAASLRAQSRDLG